MLYTLQLLVIMKSGREYRSMLYEGIDEAGLRDYENKVKWGTMSSMEPLVLIDPKGNQITLRPDQVEATVVIKVDSKQEQPKTSFADEARMRDGMVKGMMTLPRPTSTQQAPIIQPQQAAAPAPTKLANVTSLGAAFRPPMPKIRERTWDESGKAMDVTQEFKIPNWAQNRSVAVRLAKPESAEEATQPMPKISENAAEPVSVGPEGNS